jgi:hypothetical protein
MSSPVQSLTCAQCGFLNEVERVYCHNCGEKLDRSVLPREDDTKARESIKKTQKRIKKMTNPGSGVRSRELKAGAKVLIYSVLSAALILVVHKPDDIPDPRADPGPRVLSSELAAALDSGHSRQLVFSEAEVNAHLLSVVKAKPGSESIPGVKFVRAFTQLQPGLCRVGIQQSLWGFPFYSTIAYNVEVKDGAFSATQVGGSFGRLPVPARVMRFLDLSFRKVWAALGREQEQLAHVRTLSVDKDRVGLVTKDGK